MNDMDRLIKLISLVGWSEQGRGAKKCGMRYPSGAHEGRFTEEEATAGHMMCSYYAGAISVEHTTGHDRESAERDRQELPVVTLDFVTNLSGNAVAQLGDMVRSSLGLFGGKAAATTLGTLWVDDTTATCWRLAVDNHQPHDRP